MPRIVGNNIDVTNCTICVVYQKSDEVGNIYYGEPNTYMCEDVELDEQGFHECLVIWVDQMIYSDETIIKRYPEQVEKIHNILDNVRLQQESN